MEPYRIISIDELMIRDAALHCWASPFYKTWESKNGKPTYKNYRELVNEGWTDKQFMEQDLVPRLSEICTAEILQTKYSPDTKARYWDVKEENDLTGDVYHSVKSIHTSPSKKKRWFPYSKDSYKYETANPKMHGLIPCTQVWFWELAEQGGYELDAKLWGVHPPDYAYENTKLHYGQYYGILVSLLKDVKGNKDEKVL